MDYRRVFESVPGLFLLIEPDAQLTIAGASDAYLRATFTEREAIVGRPLFEVFPDNPDTPEADGTAKLGASLARVIATRAPDTMETQSYDVRRPGGAKGAPFIERHWSAVNVPVLDANGEVELVIHRVEDATERVRGRRAYDDFRASEILDSITEGFFTLDRQWRFDFVNRAALAILERPSNDLGGQTLWEAYPGLEGTDFERGYRRAMNERITSSFTAFYPSHQRWYEVTAYPAPQGIAVYFRDVSEHRRVEAERERLVEESAAQRRIYEAALSNTPDLIYIFDLDHKFIYANEALLQMWGLAREEALVKSWQELGYEKWHSDMHDREIDQVIATRESVRGEVPFNGTDGRRVYDYIFAPVLGPDGAVVAVAGTARDVTDRQQAEQAIREQAARLVEADRAKDDFLATLSHELRNPLAPLRNSLSMLSMAGTVDPKVGKIHEMMERQVNHLVRLVDDLLEMSRVSRGTFALQRERVELGPIVRNAVETSEPLIQAAGHRLSISLPGEPLTLDGDPVRIAQVLSNLLNNAAKYTDDGGQISVVARRDGDMAEIRVIDNGVGIAPEAVSRMFQMFSRGELVGVRGQGGLGIGLALARRLAEMHGGTLEAHSEGAGKGSVFTLRLPLAAPLSGQAIAAPVSEEVPLAGMRILVVDDNEDSATSLGMLLELLGAEVRVEHDGPSAIAAFEPFGPDVGLLDIGMPGMDGYEVARTLRDRFAHHAAVLVALTGWGQEQDKREAREAGFDHHMVKPVEIGKLRKLLATIPRRASR